MFDGADWTDSSDRIDSTNPPDGSNSVEESEEELGSLMEDTIDEIANPTAPASTRRGRVVRRPAYLRDFFVATLTVALYVFFFFVSPSLI